jgi:hypothetical protein
MDGHGETIEAIVVPELWKRGLCAETRSASTLRAAPQTRPRSVYQMWRAKTTFHAGSRCQHCSTFLRTKRRTMIAQRLGLKARALPSA